MNLIIKRKKQQSPLPSSNQNTIQYFPIPAQGNQQNIQPGVVPYPAQMSMMNPQMMGIYPPMVQLGAQPMQMMAPPTQFPIETRIGMAEALLSFDRIYIKQQIEVGELISGYEFRNK